MIGKLLCWIGYHNWVAPLQDYIDEFGSIPLDNRVAKTSVCARCGAKYND